MIDFFKKLSDNIDNHDRIILMTHSTPDLDGLGSAIAFSEIMKIRGKECYIVAPKNLINKTLNKALKYLQDDGVVLPFKYEDSIDGDNDLLVIFDTHEDKLVESSSVLHRIKDRCFIDHHSKAEGVIEDTICEYLDDSKSSTVEIICEYLLYLGIDLDSIYNTVLLAGLYQDTNYFNLKTTSRTFEIASYLISSGASIKLEHEFLKEPMESVARRYEYIKKSSEIDNNVFLAIVDDRFCTNITVAKIADEMLKLDGVDVALAIGKREAGDFVISARSCGDIDVCSMMMQLGGGGHFGAAAARVDGSSLDEVIEKIKLIVRGR